MLVIEKLEKSQNLIVFESHSKVIIYPLSKTVIAAASETD